jgi:hypothetical protein
VSTILGLPPGLHPNISEKDYHADNLCEVPTLSCSLSKVLIGKSPLHAWHAHPRLGAKGEEHDSTPEQELGSASHKLNLGKGADIDILDADDWRKGEARDFRKAARAAGRIPLLRKNVANLELQRAELRRQLSDRGLLEMFDAALPELVCVYDDGPVRCRAMLDKTFIDEANGRAVIFDLKNCESANPGGLGKLIFNQHYDMQERSYVRGLECVRPDLAGKVEFRFLFIETEAPFCLTVAELDGESRTLGASKWARAWQMWHECLKQDRWPAYGTALERIAPPGWGLAAEMGANPILPSR